MAHSHGLFHDLFNNPENLVLPQNEVFFAIELDLGAGILAEQDAVAGLDFRGDALARIEQLSAAYSLDFGLLRLFLGAIGNDDAAAALLAFFQAANQNAIV
jgi:hypothetical protein